MSEEQGKKLFRVNRYLKIGFILGILQFLIYLSGYDQVLRLGPFVAHHFVELPAFFILGMGFAQFFNDLNFSFMKSQILNILMITMNIFIGPGSKSASGLYASYIVSFPELIGYYFYQYLLYRNSHEKNV